MGWRSVVISQPARLSCAHRALQIEQDQGKAQVPLEDISVLVLDQPQVSLSASLLSALAQEQIAVLTVGADHHPNGVLLPFLPHSRGVKVMRAQLALSGPQQKRLWQSVVKQKLRNQADVLLQQGQPEVATQVQSLAARVRSGDPDNLEAQAARVYFVALFGRDFQRGQERFYNAALNYGYAVIRAAIARTICSYGLLPAFGLHHCSELNAFNLADDLIEPWRPMLDAYILRQFPNELENQLTPQQKGVVVAVLHQDVVLTSQAGRCSSLVAIDTSVQSLVRILNEPAKTHQLALPSCSGMQQQEGLFEA